MERKEKEKGVEREEEGDQEEEEEEMTHKSKRGLLLVNGVGIRRAGPSTPSPTWRLDFLPSSSSPPPPLVKSSAAVDHKPVSARKLCANLWEIEQLSVPKMRRGVARPRREHQNKDKQPIGGVDPGDGPPHLDQPLSTGSLRRQIAASMLPHHRLVERNGPSVQPVSPASYDSSMEVAPFKTAFTPTSSLDFKDRNGEPSYSLGTSTELLKVLNRICCLEEQHASNMSLVKALKNELEHCRTEVRDLQRGKKSEREEIMGLKRRAEENNIMRKKNKDQERLKAAIQSVRDELEDERKLRRQSENLHRKLARELSEVKFSFSGALKELERERNARILLENLCDEFAKAVKGYEQEARVLKGKSLIQRENHDRLILHISEAWLDERLQLKIDKGKDDLAEKNSVVDKLGLDIDTFLQFKHAIGSRKRGQYFLDEEKKANSHRHSLESYALNYDGVSAEHYNSDSHCLELNKSANSRQRKGRTKENAVTSEFVDSNSVQQRGRLKKLERMEGLSDLQEQFEIGMARSGTQFPNKDKDDVRRDDKLQVDLHGRKNIWVDQLIRNQSFSSEGDKIHPESNAREDDNLGESSLARSDLEKSESCSKLCRNVNENNNTLQAKLIEARLESRHSRSRSSKTCV